MYFGPYFGRISLLLLLATLTTHYIMNNDNMNNNFAIFNGQSVLILEQTGTTAWVSFKDGEEMEVSMHQLELL
jgi:hypothetical protein